MKRKRRQRSLDALYKTAPKISEPTVTPVLEGKWRMQGPVEDADSDLEDTSIKICDICGDAGRERFLARCSRCNDGAEHIYCMRIALEKVPECNWFCEECQLKEDAENKNSDKFEHQGLKQTEERDDCLHTEPQVVQNMKRPQSVDETPMRIVEPNRVSYGTSMELKSPLAHGAFLGILNASKKLKPGNLDSVHDHQSAVPSKAVSNAITSSGPTSPKVFRFSQCVPLKSSSAKSRAEVKCLPDGGPNREKIIVKSASTDIKKERSPLGSSASFKGRNNPIINSAGRVQSVRQMNDIGSMKHDGQPRVSLERSASFTFRRRFINSSSATRNLPKIDAKFTCAVNQKQGRDASAIQEIREKCCSTTTQSDQFNCPTEKNKMNGNFRHPLSSFDGVLHFGGCNERGHGNTLCRVDKLQLSPYTSSGSCKKEMSYKIIKRNDAVDIAGSMTKNYKNGELGVRPNGLPLSSNIQSKEGIVSTKVCHGGKQHTLMPSGAKQSCKDNSINEDEDSEVKFKMQVIQRSYVHASSLKISGIPKLDYIWQGCFVVQRTGKPSEVCEGLQAHLSTCASAKAVDAATNLPIKLQLDEVARVSSWPAQFQGKCPTEDNIALFFFATDITSYQKSYKRLLRNMLDNDLALKANLDGVDLLIFPSKKLIKRSQRWNRLLYLWGVFKAKESDYMDSAIHRQKLHYDYSSNVALSDNEFCSHAAAEHSGIQREGSYENSKENRFSIHKVKRKIYNSHCDKYEISSKKLFPTELHIGNQPSDTLHGCEMTATFKQSAFLDSTPDCVAGSTPDCVAGTDVHSSRERKADACCLRTATFDLNEKADEDPDSEITGNYGNEGSVTLFQGVAHSTAASVSGVKNGIVGNDLPNIILDPSQRWSISVLREPVSQTSFAGVIFPPGEAIISDESQQQAKRSMHHEGENCVYNGAVDMCSKIEHGLSSNRLQEFLGQSVSHQCSASFQSPKDNEKQLCPIVSCPSDFSAATVIPSAETSNLVDPDLELVLGIQKKTAIRTTT